MPALIIRADPSKFSEIGALVLLLFAFSTTSTIECLIPPESQSQSFTASSSRVSNHIRTSPRRSLGSVIHPSQARSASRISYQCPGSPSDRDLGLTNCGDTERDVACNERCRCCWEGGVLFTSSPLYRCRRSWVCVRVAAGDDNTNICTPRRMQ